ncbi:hypothetical protein EYR40_006044 [Pleurotus pulmonarius]|nr:hypothetical protein EYR36_005575 [Pleurotus pulmonarius]KAF4602827.1 hypothetical protein EYR40_006044 [Pleurotus pulmonarius]
MATLHERRHFVLAKNILRHLTAPYVWENWCKFCCCNVRPEVSLERCYFQSYNVRTRPRVAERDRAGWQPLLQRSLRQVVLGEDSGMCTARLGKSANSDDKSRRALEALYGVRPNITRLPNKDIFQHIEVSYVDVAGVLRTPFVMTLVTELQPVRDNDSHGPAIKDLDIVDDNFGWSPIALITNAQERVRTMGVTESEGARVRCGQSEETPAADGEECPSSGDDTLAAGSSAGSSLHNATSGDTAEAVDAVAEEKGDDVNDSEEVDEGDDDDRVPDAGEVQERKRTMVKVFRIDEFGVMHRNGGYEDHSTIRPRLVPSGAPRVRSHAHSKKILRVLRNVLGIKQ